MYLHHSRSLPFKRSKVVTFYFYDTKINHLLKINQSICRKENIIRFRKYIIGISCQVRWEPRWQGSRVIWHIHPAIYWMHFWQHFFLHILQHQHQPQNHKTLTNKSFCIVNTVERVCFRYHSHFFLSPKSWWCFWNTFNVIDCISNPV